MDDISIHCILISIVTSFGMLLPLIDDSSRSKELWTTLSSLVGGICTYQIYMYGGQRWLMPSFRKWISNMPGKGSVEMRRNDWPMRRGQKLRTYLCRLLSPWWECRYGRKQRAINGKVEASIADFYANRELRSDWDDVRSTSRLSLDSFSIYMLVNQDHSKSQASALRGQRWKGTTIQ